MVNIYVGKKFLPQDKKFYYDPNGLIPKIDLTLDDMTKSILKEIEQAVPQTNDTFIDRFGRGFYTSALSTSTHILIGAHQNTDIIVNGDELGENAFWYLDEMTTGNIYFSDAGRPIENLSTPIALNGKVCNDANELYDAYMETCV